MEFNTEEEAKEYVKSQLESYLQRMGIDTRKHFKCLNPNHRDENPSMSYDRKRQKAHCFSCGVDYDTIDVIAIEEGYSIRDERLYERIKEIFHIKVKKREEMWRGGKIKDSKKTLSGKSEMEEAKDLEEETKKPKEINPIKVKKEMQYWGSGRVEGSGKTKEVEDELSEVGSEDAKLREETKRKVEKSVPVLALSPDGHLRNTPESAQNARDELADVLDRKTYVEKCRNALRGSKGEEYLMKRGITRKVMAQCHIGYDESKRAIVIPYMTEDSYYITRSIDEKEYRKPLGMKEPLYEMGEKESGIVYVVEGQIDAISLIQAGVKYVVAIGGGGVNKLEVRFKGEKSVPLRAVIVRDNDEAGEGIAERITEILTRQGIACKEVSPTEGYKDVNEMLQAEESKLREKVKEWEEEALLLEVKVSDNMEEYMAEGFDSELLRFQKYKDRKTGFANIDEETSLYPGLYVLGAISSLGKTTFAHQLADQLSERGDKVLYFSLEQNRLEMASKGLSRLTAQENLKTAVSAIDIRRGVKTKPVMRAREKYKKMVHNENLIECGFETTIDDIVEYVEKYIKETESSPVVIIDYLQVLQPSKKTTGGVREGIDTNVKTLKNLQSEHDIVVLVISSFNRSSYLTPVSFESFKESGGIEYTADVVWGLQLKVVSSKQYGANQKEQRESIRKAKLAKPREIELVCLKNRYGKSSYKCKFSYYAEYDWFVRAEDKEEELIS